MDEQARLSRRERQIMSVVYSLGEATAVEVREGLSDPPSQTAVRTLLRILEEKGHLGHTKRGRQHVYQPVRQRSGAGRSAFRGVLKTFFDGSVTKALGAHLHDGGTDISPQELEEIEAMIKKAKAGEGGR